MKVRARLSVNPELGAEKLELIAHGEVIEAVEGGGAGVGEIVLEKVELDRDVPYKEAILYKEGELYKGAI